jgi:hypothetical protein
VYRAIIFTKDLFDLDQNIEVYGANESIKGTSTWENTKYIGNNSSKLEMSTKE